MPRSLQAVRSMGGVLLLTLGALGAADAQVIVTPTVTFASGLFHYAYSISNPTTSDLFDVDISVPTDASAGTTVVQNLTAPLGFIATNDSVSGLVSFLEDTSTFGASPKSGFAFDSPLRPGGANFYANLAPPGSNQINTQGGRTQAPTTPEPGSLAVFGALTASGVFAVRHKSRRK